MVPAKVLLMTGSHAADADIAVLWKKPDGTSCILSKRETRLFLSLQRSGRIVMEKAVESPREAMDLALIWKTLPIQNES